MAANTDRIRVLSWNLYHGRDRPPDPTLFTWRSWLFGVTARNETHVQVNRNLLREFTDLLAGVEWDVALLQECPPRWEAPLAAACGAETHRVLTARNSFGWLRGFLADCNPDLMGSWEGGSNLILVRRGAVGAIAVRRQLLLRQRWPERRTMAFIRLDGGLCVANLHATANHPERSEPEIRSAAEQALAWSRDTPLVFGGDFNLRPNQTTLFAELHRRHRLGPPTAPHAIDHLLFRGLRVVEPPTPWPPEAREIEEGGLKLRLSDHAPISAIVAPA